MYINHQFPCWLPTLRVRLHPASATNFTLAILSNGQHPYSNTLVLLSPCKCHPKPLPPTTILRPAWMSLCLNQLYIYINYNPHLPVSFKTHEIRAQSLTMTGRKSNKKTEEELLWQRQFLTKRRRNKKTEEEGTRKLKKNALTETVLDRKKKNESSLLVLEKSRRIWTLLPPPPAHWHIWLHNVYVTTDSAETNLQRTQTLTRKHMK